MTLLKTESAKQDTSSEEELFCSTNSSVEEETSKPDFPLNKIETNKKANLKEKVKGGGEENTKFAPLCPRLRKP